MATPPIVAQVAKDAIGTQERIALAFQSAQLLEQNPAFGPRQPQVLAFRVRIKELHGDPCTRPDRNETSSGKSVQFVRLTVTWA